MSASACHGFALPEDGWFHIAVPGEWPHKPTGLLQVLDDDALNSIVSNFVEYSQQPNWPGVLIDFDHQSLDVDKPSVAAGWIVSLEKRPTGIWAQIRWSDLGKKSIEGGRYRFISPVWRSTDCALLGDDRIRPLKLMNCAVTNDPNIKGLFPLSNADTIIPMRFAPPALPISPAIRLRMHGTFLLQNATIRNRKPLTDEQLRLLHARGGRGGGGPRANTSSFVSAASSTAPDPAPRYARDHEGRIASLEAQRADIESRGVGYRPEKRSFEQIDVRQTEREAMRYGSSSTDVIRAVREAKATNAERQAELAEIKRNIRKQHKTKEARNRALDRFLSDEDRQHAKRIADWQRDVGRRESDLQKIDQQIDAEIYRQSDSERRADIRDAQQAVKDHKQAIKDQIAADKAELRAQRDAEREAARQRREQERAEQAPQREYSAEVRRRAAYVNAMSRGDYDYARRIYPEANHDAMRTEIDAIMSADAGSVDARKVKRHLDALKNQPIPLARP